MSFATPEMLSGLPKMSHSQIDALDFGVIQVDNTGVVKFYNRYESELACVAPAAAQGRNFFKEVAPCTNNRLVYGKFTDGVANGKLDVAIPYTFTYKMRPTNVNIHLYHDSASKTNWVLVKKR